MTYRSLLVLPGDNARFMEKAAGSDADAVLLDLEDAVAAGAKEAARRSVVEGLNRLDWGSRRVMTRINSADTPWMFRDVIEIVSGAGSRIQALMLPKVEGPRDIHALDVLLNQLEAECGLAQGGLEIEALIESAAGLASVEATTKASPRLRALHFGPADFAASMGVRSTAMGGADPDYRVLTAADADGSRHFHWNDAAHYPLSRIAVAARADGLRPIDGAFADFPDAEGFEAQAKRARALGFEGKWCIHPSQVEIANRVFSPSREEVAAARRILEAMAGADEAGRGALVLDGRMIDIATRRQAEAIMARADHDD